MLFPWVFFLDQQGSDSKLRNLLLAIFLNNNENYKLIDCIRAIIRVCPLITDTQTIRPCSVNSLDGGATDVPTLGLMQTCRFQNLLWIENRTIINRDTVSFVQEGQFLHINCYKNTQNMSVYMFFLPTGNHGNRKKILVLVIFIILYFQPTDYQKGSRKIRHPMNQPGMALPLTGNGACCSLLHSAKPSP